MTTPDELFSQLRALAASQPEGHAMYALLDSAIYAGATASDGVGLYGNLAAQLPGARMASLFAHAFDDTRTEASPLLVSLPDLDGELTGRLVALADRYSLASWLWSPLSMDDLARHLAAFIRAEFGGTAVMLRPYDPRIMADTIACFDPARQAALMAPVEAWAYFDGDEALKRLPRPFGQPSPMGVTEAIKLSRGEQQRLEHLANRIALEGYIESHAPVVFDSLSVAERKIFCDDQIKIGARLSTDSMADLLIIATLSYAHGAQWIDSEAVVPLLQSVMSGAASLNRVATAIDERLNQQQVS
ncbi:DUF4123 domain-containing protein [Paraburkholderia sp. DD10]|uniref:DUF4123 domain-containing protein n=1 Tax=Paraburkholderia sp. DD10 TaxID=3409691 RepID=UPI003BA24BDA